MKNYYYLKNQNLNQKSKIKSQNEIRPIGPIGHIGPIGLIQAAKPLNNLKSQI